MNQRSAMKQWADQLRTHGSFSTDEIRSFFVANKLLHFPSKPDSAATRIWERNPSVALQASPVHGQGLFATRDIEPDELLTIYPVHMVYWDSGEHRIYIEGSHGKPAVQRWQFDYATSGDAFGCKFDLVGFPTVLEPGYLGHMINDRLKLTCASGVDAYNRLGPDVTNVRLGMFSPEEQAFEEGHDTNLYVLSTKHIRAGEELFLMYGEAYWLKKLQLDQHDQHFSLSTMD